MHRTNPSDVRRRLHAPVEPLEGRAYLAAHAALLTGPGILNIFGDNLANAVTVSRDAGGAILVNGGAVRVAGGAPTVATTREILVHAFGGNDHVTLDETGGALPRAIVLAGSGDDVIT